MSYGSQYRRFAGPLSETSAVVLAGSASDGGPIRRASVLRPGGPPSLALFDVALFFARFAGSPKNADLASVSPVAAAEDRRPPSWVAFLRWRASLLRRRGRGR